MIEAIPGRRAMRQRVGDARRRSKTTPGRLRMLSLAITIASIALTVIGTGALVAAEVTAVGMQQRTVPAIVGMQRLHAWLSDADRSAAGAYLAGGSEVSLSQLQYEADIAAANRELQLASQHNPGGNEASQQLQAVAVSISTYASLVQTASVDDRQAIATGNPALGAAGTVYLQAGSTLMHRPGGILAQVEGLREMYAAGLDRANLTLRITASLIGLYAVVALVVLVLLAGTHRFVKVRFRRRRNPRLYLAMLLLVVVGAGGGAGALQASQDIRSAEDHDISRLVSLYQARALAYDANGNEGLSLIAGGTGGAYDAAFRAETAKLVDRPLTDKLMQDAEHGQIRFNGLLADGLRAASPGEKADALKVLRAYRTFIEVDATVRSEAQNNNQRLAVTTALGTDKGQLVFAFDELDYDLGVFIQHFQSEFDGTMQQAEITLGVTAGLELLAMAIAALTFWGLRPRIAEYTSGGR
ncbi:MAG: hypothetical protein J2P45_08385 [Candidatus Dormibacteraeota bacterium]|nr:hypothetical protein [Candidatus Dormibacteraeota bacterium]